MRIAIKRILGVAVSIMFVLMLAAAQAAVAEEGAVDTKVLLERIEKLELEIAVLKDMVKQQASKEKAAPVEAVTFSGKAYLAYTFDTDGADKSDNRFTVDRWYMDAKKNLGDRISIRLTTDVAASPDSSKTKFNLYMKYAYLKIDRVMPGTSLLFGTQAAPWVGNEEKAWKYRAIRKILADDKGLMTSSDFGIGLQGVFARNRGDFQVLLSNGEGYGSEEESTNANAKDLTTRVSWSFGKNAPRLSLYGDKGSAGGVKSNRFAAMLDQQISGFSYGVSFVQGEDGTTKKRGLSIFSNYDITGSKWSVLGRYDRYDPARGVTGDLRTLALGGLAYKYSKNAKMIFSYHQDRNRALEGTGADSKDAMFKAVMEVGY